MPKHFRDMAIRLGRAERKTERATVSLIAIIFVHLGCHSIKAVINGFQVWQVSKEEVFCSLILPQIAVTFPPFRH